MFASRKTLPDIKLIASPTLALRIARVCIHESKHFLDSALAIGHNSLNQQFTHKGIQRGLMTLRIASASFQNFLVERESYVFHIHSLYVHTKCVHH